jgi:mRNA interferase YafQ
MRTIRYTNRFRRDYKREKTRKHGKTLDDALMEIVNLLVADMPLPYHNFDHPLHSRFPLTP